jgi:hypothetical protein
VSRPRRGFIAQFGVIGGLRAHGLLALLRPGGLAHDLCRAVCCHQHALSGAGADNINGTAASRLTTATMAPNGNTFGATGGTQTNTATTSINSSGSNAINYGALALAGGTAGPSYSLMAQLATIRDHMVDALAEEVLHLARTASSKNANARRRSTSTPSNGTWERSPRINRHSLVVTI